jgi:Fe(3+) dicitrate transport protein
MIKACPKPENCCALVMARAATLAIALALASAPLSPSARAQEESSRAEENVLHSDLGPIQVFGTDVETLNQPLTPQKVSKKKVETYQYTDVNRALRTTSGVYVREEEGQGLRPNIGLRGTNPDRSKKIVLLEDGVLIGPAPYSAPAAYFTPSMNQTESLDVFKGFAAIPYGPNSIGGAVNYQTPSVPLTQRTDFSGAYGSFNTSNLKLQSGGPAGAHGYFVQLARLSSDGFKKIDGGGNAGFTQNQFLGKFDFKLSPKQSLNLKVGYNDENSHETYLGLSQTDFDANPYRRYSASANDLMKWHHTRVQLRHNWQISNTATLETVAYRHDLKRTWYRLDRFRSSSVNLRDVLNTPTGSNQIYYDVLRGTADSSSVGVSGEGELVLANNDRRYFAQGLQTKLAMDLNQHAMEFSARVHQDQIQRNHTADNFEMTNGRLQRTTAATQTDTLNRERATALTLVWLDNWRIGPWTLTPAVRYEDVSFEFDNHLTQTSSPRRDRFFVPGLAITRKIGDRFSIRTSVNQAATVAGLSSDGGERREEAMNYEVELKHRDPLANQEFNLTLFRNDYRNLTGTCTVSAGCTSSQLDTQFNGGKARIEGVEFSAAKGLTAGAVSIPLQANVTYLAARFLSDFNSQSPEWGKGAVTIGDPLPYVPALQYSLSAGTEFKRFKQDFTLVYQSSVFDQAVSQNRVTVPAFTVLDWAARLQLSKQQTLTAKIDNVLGKDYAVAARPFGWRPGKPQAFQIGWTYTF